MTGKTLLTSTSYSCHYRHSRVIPFSRGTTKECNERNGMREGRSDERVRERTGSHHSSRRFLSPAHTSLLSLLLSLGALYVHPSLRTEWVRSEGRKERVTTRTTGVTEGWAGWKGKERQWRDRPSRLCFSRSVHPCPSPPVVLSCRVPCPSSLHTSLHPAYRSYFLGSVVLSSHSPPVTPFRAHFVHSPLRAVGEWNETEDVSGERTEHERERSEPRTERSRYGRGKELMNGGFYYGFYGFLLLFS